MEKCARNRAVLLVEDSDDDAFFFERALAHSGVAAHLQRFSDGGAAIGFLEQACLAGRDLASSVLFLDLKLPVLSGFEVLRWIRKRGLSLEIIVLSGSDLDGDIDAARELGAAAFIVKPITSTQLRQRLQGASVMEVTAGSP